MARVGGGGGGGGGGVVAVAVVVVVVEVVAVEVVVVVVGQFDFVWFQGPTWLPFNNQSGGQFEGQG